MFCREVAAYRHSIDRSGMSVFGQATDELRDIGQLMSSSRVDGIPLMSNPISDSKFSNE